MRSSRSLLASLAAALTLALSPTAVGQPVNDAAAIHQPQALREDFAVLRAAIEEGHPGARRYMSAAALEQAFASAAARLDAPTDSLGLYRVTAPLIAALNDGHTSINLSEADAAAFRGQALLMPLRVQVRDGRLFVLRDLTGGALAGREITSVNGERAGDLVAAMMAVTPGDGAIRTGREHRLSTGLRFNQAYARMRGSSLTYRVRLLGAMRARTIEGRDLATLEQIWEQRFPADHQVRPAAELRFDDGGAIAVLTIRGFARFADVARERPMDGFFADAFGEIATRRSRALILDLRDNGGGSDDLGRQLFAYLAAQPFGYYDGLFVQSGSFSFAEHATPPVPGPPPDQYEADEEGRLRWRENPNYGVHQPEAARFSGPVFVLMNGGSFSTTAEFLSVAHYHQRAVFIGEEPGGGYFGNTSGFVLTVSLPHSGLRLRLPLQRYELAVAGFAPTDRGVPPGYPVTASATDFLAGRDRAMETALRLARQRD